MAEPERLYKVVISEGLKEKIPIDGEIRTVGDVTKLIIGVGGAAVKVDQVKEEIIVTEILHD